MSDSVTYLTEPFMTVEKVAELLAVSTVTVRNRIKDGTLPGVKIGKEYRISPVHLEKFLEHGATSVYKEYVELLEREAAAVATIGERG